MDHGSADTFSSVESFGVPCGEGESKDDEGVGDSLCSLDEGGRVAGVALDQQV